MTLKLMSALALAASLSACAAVETSTRNVPIDLPTLQPGEVSPAYARNYRVLGVQVNVPQTLRVSESNGYYPSTDIVWRGDPLGDRHVQVAALFETAAANVTPSLKGADEVFVQISVARFHGVTERTRYSVGGVYNMVFDMQVTDPQGNIIEPLRRIEANLPAPGGQAALELEQAGQTEKVRVVEYLNFVLNRELTAPTGV